MNGHKVKEMLGSTCTDDKEDAFKIKKKIRCFSDLEPSKFVDKYDIKDVFNDPVMIEERNKMNF